MKEPGRAKENNFRNKAQEKPAKCRMMSQMETRAGHTALPLPFSHPNPPLFPFFFHENFGSGLHLEQEEK